jgi:hypothetical protein
MIWAILALLGVPLWLCAGAILALVLRNRSLRRRGNDIPARRRLPGKKHWTRGHAIWIHDVLAFRASPAAWTESLLWVTAETVRRPDADQAHRLRRLGPDPVIVAVTDDSGRTVEFATDARHAEALSCRGKPSVESRVESEAG